MLPFDKPEYLAINEARLEHLASLGLDLVVKSVLEVGAGVGQLTGFFEERICRVVSVEGRKANVVENLRRHHWRRGGNRVLYLGLHTDAIKLLPSFDVVFCYGTLYHVSDPPGLIAKLADKCRELFLLETCVNSVDDGAVKFVKEPSAEADQSVEGFGCRPARDWVMAELRKHFDYVYLTRTQPCHDDFPLEWPSQNAGNSRAVFVASRSELDLPTLSTELLTKQERYEGNTL